MADALSSPRGTTSRRALLRAGGLALCAGASGALPLFLRRALAATESPERRKVLVVLFQRSGMDGLLAATPYADASLARLRPNLMLSAPGSGRDDARMDLDGRFGLHPALAPLMPLYKEGSLALVHAAGSPDPTRSHGEAQRNWESGAPGDRSQRDGWLGRALGATAGTGEALLPAAALGEERPRILYGERAVPSIESLDALRPVAGDDAAALAELERAYREHEHPALRAAGERSFELPRRLRASGKSAEALDYPAGSPLGESLHQIAELIHADVGLRVAFAESRKAAGGKGTWDTHSRAAQDFPPVAADLASSLVAFWRQLGERRGDVALVTLTDFGRNVVENDRLGVDHGRATAMFVLGGGVRGGVVHGALPERFERDALEDGMDLPVTTDFRSVLEPLVRTQLGIEDVASVFPGWRGPRLAGLVRA